MGNRCGHVEDFGSVATRGRPSYFLAEICGRSSGRQGNLTIAASVASLRIAARV